METIVNIKSLAKQYDPPNGVNAVKGITFDIYKGEIFSLLGPNGSGKTSTIGMLSGLLSPSSGDAVIKGYSISKDPGKSKQYIGVVPQEIALYLGLSAYENLDFWGKMYGLNKEQRKRRIDAVLEIADLSDRAHDKVEKFSGGMQRRLNIAAGILHEPDIVYMDEPTVGIDPQSRRLILDNIKKLNQQGMTVLYSTHYMEEAEELSDRIGIIDQGRMIALGTQAELTRQVGAYNSIQFDLQNLGVDLTSISASLAQLSHVHQTYVDADTLVLETDDVNGTLPQAIDQLNQAKLPIKHLSIKEPNLESLFLQLTGRALRD